MEFARRVEKVGQKTASGQKVGMWRRGDALPRPDIIGSILRAIFADDIADPSRIQLETAWKEAWYADHIIEAESDVSAATAPLEQPPIPFKRVLAVNNLDQEGIRIPRFFLGRDDLMDALDELVNRAEPGVVATAMHGLRGVGKTVVAAAYAERHLADYRVIWWINARTDIGIRTALLALGVRLGWIHAEDKEEQSIPVVMERLRNEGKEILLIYDNVIDADSLRPNLPRGGEARVLITSNSRVWRSLAEPIEIHVWPDTVGAEYLIRRTDGLAKERAVAEQLSKSLGGLPLALEQAAAYCDALGVGFNDYRRRFEAAKLKFLDDKEHAPTDYHPEYQAEWNSRLTVLGTFTLAINQVAKRRRAAKTLLINVALLPLEPIPCYFFLYPEISKSIYAKLSNETFDHLVAVLQIFALIDRKQVVDDYDPDFKMDCVSLHPLVREIAGSLLSADKHQDVVVGHIKAMSRLFPYDNINDPNVWPILRRLSPIALSLVIDEKTVPDCVRHLEIKLLSFVVTFEFQICGSYKRASAMAEETLRRCRSYFGERHNYTLHVVNQLAIIYKEIGRLDEAETLLRNGVAVSRDFKGDKHFLTAELIASLAAILNNKRMYAEARPLYEEALGLFEDVYGLMEVETAMLQTGYARLLCNLGEFHYAYELARSAINILEIRLGVSDPNFIAIQQQLSDLIFVFSDQTKKQTYVDQLRTLQNMLGDKHPDTIDALILLGRAEEKDGDVEKALAAYREALVRAEASYDSDHKVIEKLRRSIAELSGKELNP